MTVETRPVSSPTISVDSKRPDIQGLRALAVLMVVVFHAGLPLPAGFAGVDVFFVISGYVITGQIQRLQARNAFSFADFYARRIRRLLPAMVVLLTTVLLASFFLESPLDAQPRTAETAVGSVLLGGNAVIAWTGRGGYFGLSAVGNPLLHMWSLSVEEQFYLFFPALIVLVGRYSRRRRAWVLGACTVVSLLLALKLTASSATMIHGIGVADFSFYAPFTRAWEFGAGVLLAVWVAGRAPADVSRPRRWALAGAGALALLVTQVVVSDGTLWPGTATLLPVLGTAAIIGAGALGANPVSRALSTTWLVRVGDLSYSLYLWHWPVILFATTVTDAAWAKPVAAAASFLPAYLSHRYVETPLRTRSSGRRTTFSAGLVATAGLVVVAVALSQAAPRLIREASELRSTMHAQTVSNLKGCQITGRDYRPDDIERCTIRLAHPKGWIMLAGDSHASALSTGVVDAARLAGYDTVSLQGAGCGLVRGATSRFLANCAELSGDLIDRAVGANPPSLVIMSHRITSRLLKDPEWTESLRPTLRELHAAGVPVLYVLDVPNFAPPNTGLGSSCRGGWLLFDCTRSRAGILEYQGRSRAQEIAVAGSEPGVRLLDPWPTFCTGDTCSSVLNGRLAYQDLDHLNAIGSQALTQQLEDAIRTDAR